jgi:hypothetical protein
MNVTQSTVVCVDVAAHDLDRDAPLLGHFVDAHGAIELPKEMAAHVLDSLPTISEIRQLKRLVGGLGGEHSGGDDVQALALRENGDSGHDEQQHDNWKGAFHHNL